MATAGARIDQAGRILIPPRLQTELKIGPGHPVVLETSGDELRIRPYRQAIREAQAIVRKYVFDQSRSLVDELIAERRQEAERD
jgi:bifunctional DNA-binding transcriptional regulator/antitoxin component of YhaV-PrlF toxin-antitoxin module